MEATSVQDAAAERKRLRLEAWKRRQQQQQQQAAAPVVKVSLSLTIPKKDSKQRLTVASKKKNKTVINPFGGDDDEKSAEYKEDGNKKMKKAMGFHLDDDEDDDEGVTANDDTWGMDDERPARPPPPPLDLPVVAKEEEPSATTSRKRRKVSRWDNAPTAPPSDSKKSSEATTTTNTNTIDDALDNFMEKLQAGALGNVVMQETVDQTILTIDVGGSMMRVPKLDLQKPVTPVSGGAITAEELARWNVVNKQQQQQQQQQQQNHPKPKTEPDALYSPRDWESDAPPGDAESANEAETDDEEEEKARRAFIEALKSAPTPFDKATSAAVHAPQLAAEVKSEKHRREVRLKDLEREAEVARVSADAASAPEFGRLYNDLEGGVMEEAERNLDAAKAAPDALVVLAELNKKKELKAVDHSKIDYLPFRKNLYIVPRSLALLSDDEVADRRGKLKVKVRGKGAPAPVSTFDECGLSERILQVLERQDITQPFPVQAQCLPCIMAGRDVIGIAKTGSGKTLAYLLPLLRHIADQPPLAANESGPIGLILAPARELAYQIHLVCKAFCKNLGLKSTAVYGGAAVAEQIADLKRGTHIAVATPGRLIDILTMQAGKILSLKRVTYVVLDEADRMYDMGFAPQITAILSAVRPDRQTVLFSATFPKAVENLARKSLQYPIEVIVGARSIASDSVTQYAEVVEEDEKFLRLLQLLGENADENSKVLIFVDTQVRADSLFEQLLRNGYPALSLHGGKEQEERDSTIADFKRKDGPNILVATGVAGRGLDVQSCKCVINYSAPSHLEAYVHQVGRTGRASHRGKSYTFVNSNEEAKFAPIIVRALSEAGQSENISPALKELAEEYKAKVEKGEARWAGSGFKGKGFSYDSTEMNEGQKLARLEKRQALIEAGLLDPEDEEAEMKATNSDDEEAEATEEKKSTDKKLNAVLDLQQKLTPELLALPGMKDAILRRAGIIKEPEDEPSLGRPFQYGPNHFVMEFEIDAFPRESRWRITQKETTSRLQDEFQTAVTLKGEYFGPNRTPGEGQRRLYLHLEATSERILENCVREIQRLLNEETLRVAARGPTANSGSRYNVFG